MPSLENNKYIYSLRDLLRKKHLNLDLDLNDYIYDNYDIKNIESCKAEISFISKDKLSASMNLKVSSELLLIDVVTLEPFNLTLQFESDIILSQDDISHPDYVISDSFDLGMIIYQEIVVEMPAFPKKDSI
ncbi:MAG: hypothetical protein LBV58_03620 [Acholeplasmatales bacterium]|jgi:hypothetical protein|nr:hypothetical protein [Acholeplasmatales bacterium]